MAVQVVGLDITVVHGDLGARHLGLRLLQFGSATPPGGGARSDYLEAQGNEIGRINGDVERQVEEVKAQQACTTVAVLNGDHG